MLHISVCSAEYNSEGITGCVSWSQYLQDLDPPDVLQNGEAADLVLITMEMSAQCNLPPPQFAWRHRHYLLHIGLATANTHAHTHTPHARTHTRVTSFTSLTTCARMHAHTHIHARTDGNTRAHAHTGTRAPVWIGALSQNQLLFQFHSPVTTLSERATENGSAYSLAPSRSICHFFFIQEIQIYFMSCLRGANPTALCGGGVFASWQGDSVRVGEGF